MAKNATKKRNENTGKKLEGLADTVVKYARAKDDPGFDIPTRALSNAKFDEKSGIIRMGGAATRRSFFNLSQAKKFMQTMWIAAGCKELADQSKSTSIRDLYYHSKHTIPGTQREHV